MNNAALPSRDVWTGRRVLLTGHTGFKGGWLAMWLHELGADVRGLALAPEAGSLGEALDIEGLLPSERVDIRNGVALRDAMAAAAPEVVFHLAAQSLVRPGYADPIATFETNVMGTAHLLESIRRTPSVRAVVIVTSDKCYENQAWPWPYRETDALGGHDPYSASKGAAEMVAASWRRSYLADAGIAVATARAGNVVGGGDAARDRLVPDCLEAFAKGQPVRIRNPRATRPWQHVLDPICGYLLLAEQLLNDAQYAEAWNFGPDADSVRPVSEIVGRLADAWGEGAEWQVDAGAHPHEAKLLALDASMARARLRWQPRRNLDQALRSTVAWTRRRLAGDDARRLVADEIESYQQGDVP